MSIQFELERMERLVKDINKLRYPESKVIRKYKMHEGKIDNGATCDTSDWQDYEIDTPWKDTDCHRWFRTSFQIPKSMVGKHVEFRITTGREGQWDATNPQMLFYLDGEIVQGVDVNHREIIITDNAVLDKRYEVALYAYSGTVKGDLILHTELVVLDDIINKLYYDFMIPVQAVRVLWKNKKDDARKILQILGPVADLIDLRKAYSEQFYESLIKASLLLEEEFYTKELEYIPKVSAIGHTHIDIAWLWTVEQTKEKVLRSFSTVLKLMEQYPDYKFMSSQPILYKFVKEQEPKMYEEIKNKIAEGRWEVDGAMWLEADCNLPNGESLVRQIIKGHQFFMDEFGKESKSLWLPDVFGYSAAIPQILRKTGISYFMTTKIAWNQYNQLPNDTFIWKGIDGSRVFVFMPTTCNYDKTLGDNVSFSDTRNTTTYTGIINPNMVLGTFERFQNKDLTEDTMMLYGYGDGGGGPTREMLESAKRLKYGLPGIPKVDLEFEQEFFDRTYEKIATNKEMPTWDGELYFEYHRGTYTSMGKTKRYNRKSEILYEQLETLSCLGSLIGEEYPYETINNGWDTILLNQFHDIIPGSAIEEVYIQSNKEYEKILNDGTYCIQKISEKIAEHVKAPVDSIVIINTMGYWKDDIVEIDTNGKYTVAEVRDLEGNTYKVQYISENKLIFFAKQLPPLGFKTFQIIRGEKPKQELKEWNYEFDNSYYYARFNHEMQLESLFEKEAKKEFIKENRLGNVLNIYEDRPMNWDNWDIDIYYKKKKYESDWISETKVIEAGPVRTVLETSYGFMDSVITQKVCLYQDIPRIDFINHVDWKLHSVLLKVNFPVNVNTNRATFEIQYGNVERETTNNNSWDVAKFETCGHKWADMSENGLGISLLNDCKYGHSIKDGEMSLTLIKAGIYPNENADIEEHDFTYSIYPHNGRWQDAGTVEMAYNLNVPSIVVMKEKGIQEYLPDNFSLISCNQKNCFIEMIKKAEDGNGWILRMYENQNHRVEAKISASCSILSVKECDLLENDLNTLAIRNNEFEVWFEPYEIKTFRVNFKK